MQLVTATAFLIQRPEQQQDRVDHHGHPLDHPEKSSDDERQAAQEQYEGGKSLCHAIPADTRQAIRDGQDDVPRG